MAVLNVTDANFEQVVMMNELPVLLDLYADWCQPCKQLSPLVAELAEELDGKLVVAKVDVERNPMIAQSFQVSSIPMLVVMHQGRPVGHHMGLLDKNGLLKLVEPFLPASASEVKPEELAQLIQVGRAVAVDLRDAVVFGRYRIPGAMNIPASELETRVSELVPSDGRVRVLYGRTGDDAKGIAEALQAKGVQVGFLAGGFLHWEADGLEVERG